MAYEVHNFLDQNKLYARQLNEMDEQIRRNALGVSQFNEAMVDSHIAQLRLETDGVNILLLLGDQEIAGVAIADINAVIQAESFDVTGEKTVTLETGTTHQVTWAVQPSDATQRPRFLSEDRSVVSVTSGGVVTALDVGITQVAVLCGRFRATVTVSVYKREKPSWRAGNFITVDNLDSGLKNVRFGNTSTARALCFADNDYKLTVKAGQRIQIVSTGTPYFQYAYAVYPTADTSFDERDYQDFPMVTNVRVQPLFDFDEGSTKNIDFTAPEDCYIVFVFAAGISFESESDFEAINSRTDFSITVTQPDT